MRCLFVYLCLRNIYQKWKQKSFLHAQNQPLRVVLISMELWCALTKFYQNPAVEFNPSPKLLEGLTQFIFINIYVSFLISKLSWFITLVHFCFFTEVLLDPRKGGPINWCFPSLRLAEVDFSITLFVFIWTKMAQSGFKMDFFEFL